jgi:two-component system sensor histidine kinase ChvG
VAHEIKNPLTSLRSAVETMPLARTPESRERLVGIIQHDVRRLDRLITDISDASRLDAELARWQAESLDISHLLTTVVGLAAETAKPGGPKIVLEIEGDESDAFLVMGHDTRLGQVFNNLIDNARSFSPPGTRVLVTARRDGAWIEIAVEDQGPGIKAEQVERVFDRFYTDRPEGESFGQNSGLGLSISKQIVEAHHGRIWAENLTKPDRDGTSVQVLGARFVVRLPAAIL